LGNVILVYFDGGWGGEGEHGEAMNGIGTRMDNWILGHHFELFDLMPVGVTL
jgi:hypothetical protein